MVLISESCMNDNHDTHSIPSFGHIRQVLISLDTDQGKLEIDISQPEQVDLEQGVVCGSFFDISKRIELTLKCMLSEYALTYHPYCDYRGAEESYVSEDLDQFLSGFERSDENAENTQ